MRITVHLFAQLKAAAGTGSAELEVGASCTAQDAVRRLVAQSDPALARLVLDESGVLQPTLLLFRGEEPVSWSEPVELRECDELFLASPIAGA